MILRWKKQLTALVTAAAFFALSGITVCAAPATGTTAVAGLCSHHAEHTAECLTQVSCGHAHTQDCYIQTARCLSGTADSEMVFMKPAPISATREPAVLHLH